MPRSLAFSNFFNSSMSLSLDSIVSKMVTLSSSNRFRSISNLKSFVFFNTNQRNSFKRRYTLLDCQDFTTRNLSYWILMSTKLRHDRRVWRMEATFLSHLLDTTIYQTKYTVPSNEHRPKMFLLFSHLIDEKVASFLAYLKS